MPLEEGPKVAKGGRMGGERFRDFNGDFRRLLFYFMLGRWKICPSCEDYEICKYPCERVAEFIRKLAPDLIMEEDD